MYPAVRVSFCRVRAPFSPALIEHLSRAWDIPKNMFMIACPDQDFAHRISQFGGLRVITH